MNLNLKRFSAIEFILNWVIFLIYLKRKIFDEFVYKQRYVVAECKLLMHFIAQQLWLIVKNQHLKVYTLTQEKRRLVELYFDVLVCVYVWAVCVLHGVCVQAVWIDQSVPGLQGVQISNSQLQIHSL